jgi:hypothetical protein
LGQLADLSAMGERTNDVLANLFKAYLSAPDEEFVRYITDKQSRSDEGEEINHEQLMVFAGNKYKGRVEAGTWNAPNKDQVKLLALAAELAEVKKLIPKTTGVKSTEKKATATTSKARTPIQREEWQMVKPTALEIKNNYTKNVKGKDYKWCAKHAMWCSHSTAECRKPDMPSDDKETKTNEKQDDGEDQKSKLASAFVAINTHDDDE